MTGKLIENLQIFGNNVYLNNLWRSNKREIGKYFELRKNIAYYIYFNKYNKLDITNGALKNKTTKLTSGETANLNGLL